MRKIIKYFLLIVVLAFHAVLFAGINFVTPSYEITRISSGEVKRMDKDGFITKANPADGTVRDVYFINTQNPNKDEPKVYRNEDTGWRFPFYFKFDSANVQAKALDFVSDNKLVELQYYGWRITMLSEFPNVTDIRPVNEGETTSHPILAYILYVLGLITLLVSVQLIRGWFDSEKA